MELIEFNNKSYPLYQTKGNMTQYALPFATKFCKGKGYDIGCNRADWQLPNSIPIDITLPDEWDAMNLPDGQVDFIYSSHCLEHLDRWVDVLRYWTTKIKKSGILFLYLPHYSQEYWRPWNCTKHQHVLQPEVLKDCLESLGYRNVLVSGVDLNNSFMIVGKKDVC